MAAARNPKGDKSGRGLASLRAAAGALLVDHLGWNRPTEFRAVAVKHSYRERNIPASGPAAMALGSLCWGLLGLVGP